MMNKKIKKILFINPFGIGDVLFTTPLIRNIKEAAPEVTIGYISNQRTTVILKNHPLIDRVHVYDRDAFEEKWRRSKKEYLKAVFKICREIAAEKYDLVLDFSMTGNASFLMSVLGIKKRIGYNYKGRSPFLTKKVPLKGYEGKHVVEYCLDLLKEIDVPINYRKLDLYSAPEEEKWADQFIENNNFKKEHRTIAVFPGGGASWGEDARYKRWPAEKYAQLVNRCVEELSCEIVLFGDKREEEICERIISETRHTVNSVCGQSTLGQTVALLSRCDLAVVNDGGPLHMAVAKGVPTVSVFGPVDAQVYGPYPKGGHLVVTHDVPCRPCYRKFRRAACDHITCLKNIDVNDVFGNIEQVYSNLKETR